MMTRAADLSVRSVSAVMVGYRDAAFGREKCEATQKIMNYVSFIHSTDLPNPIFRISQP